MDISVQGTIDQKTYVKKIRGGFSPLSHPLNPPMKPVAKCPAKPKEPGAPDA